MAATGPEKSCSKARRARETKGGTGRTQLQEEGRPKLEPAPGGSKEEQGAEELTGQQLTAGAEPGAAPSVGEREARVDR